ncbi:hypothetical protein LWI29_035540 [Acer saccharum]|uniref:Uncharacterized protein n=1 Tax=Acer saccharum TaxID=4024 RepID=A0AA39VEP4_ACESA|nr:hypothetical protein LWI29_035540 [Acer saccharum]
MVGTWAGSESTPFPTFFSPCVGLGTKKGAHLGLGDATIGKSSLVRPGRDLTGGGAFGIPGYAVTPQGLSSWFDLAIPTFACGSLVRIKLPMPAANVPPPYALASISALYFDHRGHRFASAAPDGTLCTWQLVVGGRSNACPAESVSLFQ